MKRKPQIDRVSEYLSAGVIALAIGIILGAWIIIATDPALIGGKW